MKISQYNTLGLGTSISGVQNTRYTRSQYNTLGLGTSISVSSEHKIMKITQYNTLGLGISISVSSKHKVHKITQYNTLGLGTSVSGVQNTRYTRSPNTTHWV